MGHSALHSCPTNAHDVIACNKNSERSGREGLGGAVSGKGGRGDNSSVYTLHPGLIAYSLTIWIIRDLQGVWPPGGTTIISISPSRGQRSNAWRRFDPGRVWFVPIWGLFFRWRRCPRGLGGNEGRLVGNSCVWANSELLQLGEGAAHPLPEKGPPTTHTSPSLASRQCHFYSG